MATTSKPQVRDRGQAGPEGDAVRSDVHISFVGRKQGGIALEVRSRVDAYYGDATRELVRKVLGELGVEHAEVRVEDYGALPFVIAARLEAAARAAGVARNRQALPEAVSSPAPSVRDRRRRSRLYLPGSEPKLFVNARLHGPDAVILDLEDSVHPDHKESSRILVRNALRAVDFGASERMVRINQLPLGIEDLDEIVPVFPDLILIPKAETPDQVLEVHEHIGKRGGKREVWLMPILESARGVEHAYEIARAAPTVVALTIGLEDYTADLGVVKTTEGRESEYARARLLNAAKAAGVQAIDSVFGDVEDMEGLRAYAARSRAMGYEGMGCIHPRQIEVVHRAFSPDRAEVERSLRIVAAFEEASRKGLGVVSLGSKMIDAPVVERARKVVEEARASGFLPEEGEP